jgi:hypothetical protein
MKDIKVYVPKKNLLFLCTATRITMSNEPYSLKVAGQRHSKEYYLSWFDSFSAGQ